MRIALIGTGLIGGSIGLGARARLGAEVCGFDADEDALRDALERGALTRAAGSVGEAVGDAELALVAAPVSVVGELVGEALACSNAGCVVSDVGSTKASVMEAVARMEGAERFVGGHPLAGHEEGGVANADGDLFEGARWFLVGEAGGARGGGARARRWERGVSEWGASEGEGRGVWDGGSPVERVAKFVTALAARPIAISADEHDRLLARVSHLPHVLANVLVAGLAGERDELRKVGTEGPSFRDATRVAGASTTVWKDIYLSNAAMLGDAIDEAIGELAKVKAMLEAGDGEGLVAWNERARRRDGESGP